jgi:hypothetical protein
LFAGAVVTFGSLLVLALEIEETAGEPMTQVTVAAVAGVIIGLVVMAVGAVVGR